MSKLIWTYWENPAGRSTPPHIQLCRETLLKNLGSCWHCEVTRKNLQQYLPDIHPNIDAITRRGELSLAIKAGIIRVFLLERYGGLWLDSDAIVLKPLDAVFDHLGACEFVGMRKRSSERRQVVNNFLGSRPYGTIINRYATKLRDLLPQRTSYVWNEIGSDMLTPLVLGGAKDSYFLYPEEDIHPLTPDQQPMIMRTDIEPERLISDTTLIFMLFHRLFDGQHPGAPGVGLRDYSIKDLYESDMLIGKIFRRILS